MIVESLNAMLAVLIVHLLYVFGLRIATIVCPWTLSSPYWGYISSYILNFEYKKQTDRDPKGLKVKGP